MRRTAVKLLCLVVLFQHGALAASGAARTREFKEYRCRLTLPGPRFQWLDHTKIPDCVAVFGDASGTLGLTMAVQKNPEGAVVNESFVKAFDKGAIQPGVTSKISGRIGRFRGVPCYQLHARYEEDGSIGTMRVFPANGYIYVLVLTGSNLPISERNKLGSIFSAFEFVGEPVLPVPKPSLSEDEVGRSTAKYKLTGLILVTTVTVIFLSIWDRIRRRKKKAFS